VPGSRSGDGAADGGSVAVPGVVVGLDSGPDVGAAPHEAGAGGRGQVDASGPGVGAGDVGVRVVQAAARKRMHRQESRRWERRGAMDDLRRRRARSVSDGACVRRRDAAGLHSVP
jgi:hypothetical protein